MANPFSQAAARFNGMKPRERLGFLAAAAAVIFFATDYLLITPEAKKKKMLAQRLETQELDVAKVTADMNVISRRLAQASVPKEFAVLEDLKRSVAEADALVGQMEEGGADLGTLVSQMIAGSPGLTLVSLKTLPTVTIYEVPGAQKTTAAPAESKTASPGAPKAKQSVYRQGVQVIVRGNYLAFLPYVNRLEQLPQKIFWSDVSLSVGEYPDSTLQMTLYTLSARSSSPLG